MGIFNLFKQPDINQGVQDYKNAAGAVLLDVRTPQEYREGHIPGSQNTARHASPRAKRTAHTREEML